MLTPANPSTPMLRMRFRRRSTLFLIAFLIWASVLLVRLFMIMVVNRDAHLERVAAASQRVGTLPASRGRILDHNGVPLAWSIRSLSLHYSVASESSVVRADIEQLAQVCAIDVDETMARAQDMLGGTLVVKESLQADDVVQLDAFRRQNPRFVVRSDYRREYSVTDPLIRRRLGTTQTVAGREVGVSGWEKEYDERLAGTAGRYRVMVDRSGVWLPETWEQITAPQPGDDVYVSIDVE